MPNRNGPACVPVVMLRVSPRNAAKALTVAGVLCAVLLGRPTFLVAQQPAVAQPPVSPGGQLGPALADDAPVGFQGAGTPEPYRVCRRANSLRGWLHGTTESIFP